MNIGETIKALRKQKGFKQGEFSSMCDISQTYLSLIESNQKEPNISTLKIIADTLKVSLPILFFMSLDKDDVPENKKHIFETIAPTLKSLISQIYTND